MQMHDPKETYLLRSVAGKDWLPVHQNISKDRHQNGQEPSILDRLEDFDRVPQLGGNLDLEFNICDPVTKTEKRGVSIVVCKIV